MAKRWQVLVHILYSSRIGSRITRVYLCGSVIFLLPVWPQMAVGGLFSPVICVFSCVVDSRLVHSTTGRQPTTGILLLVHLEVNIRRHRSPGVLFCHPLAFRLLTCEFIRQYLRSPSNRKWLSLNRNQFCDTGFSGRDTATPTTPSVGQAVFCFDSIYALLLSI